VSNSEDVTSAGHEALDGTNSVLEARDLCDELLRGGSGAAGQAALSRLLTAAARAYLQGSPDPYSGAALLGIGLSTTEASTIAAAMLYSQTLTPFEFAIWFSAHRRRADEAEPADSKPDMQESGTHGG
jgi:hypothetical protein